MPKPAVLLLAALAACSTMPHGTASSSAMAPAPAGFGPGVYSVTLAEADLPYSEIAAGRAPGMVGTWELTVDAASHAVVRFNGQEVVDMPFQVQGNQITFAEGNGRYACSGPGRYTWAATAAGLRFTRVEDPCTGRMAALTARPWTKRP